MTAKALQLNMVRPFFLISAIGLQIFVLSVDQQCTTSSSCPGQAYCSNNYCICNSGYIGNCNIPAQILTSSSTPAFLNSSQTSYFSVNPQALDHYIQFTFTIYLTNSSLLLTFTLWGDTGYITNFNSDNALAPPSLYNMIAGQNELKTTSLSFGQQPNGQNDLLILGITDNGISSNIQISVTQKKVMAMYLYEYILIALVVFIGLSIIVAAVTFLIRRRRNGNRRDSTSSPQTIIRSKPNYYNIDHFDSFMPLFPADKLSDQKLSCPICLQQIERVEVVRRTPCKHIFHSSCLDAWCLKSISCPVCRRDFSFNSLNQPRRSRTVQILSDPQYQISWQQQQQNEPHSQPQHLQIQASNQIPINK